MERKHLIFAIRNIDSFYSHTDFSEHSIKELKELLARIANEKFKGRKLAPNYLEAEKFEVASVEYDEEIDMVTIKGIDSKNRAGHHFKDEEIVNLLTEKTTESFKGPYAFVK